VEVTQMATTVREIEVIAAGSKLDQLLSRVNKSPIQEIMGRSGEVLVGREGNALMDVSVKDAVVSNLQEKFAFVAAPGTPQPLSNDLSPNESSPLNSSAKKKRKRGSKGEDSDSVSDLSGSVGLSQASPKSNGVDLTPGSNSAKRKRVRFSLKNNIVWKPHNPLPPQSLRTPPAATPRGSALKKGVPPGPIRIPPARTFRGKALSTPKRRSPKQILSVSLPKPTRSPKSLLKGPRFARRVSKSPGSLS
jgi:ribosomal RNA-processing protein 1